METASWDPTAYGRFASERSRPFADLLAQVRSGRAGARRRPRLRARPRHADPGAGSGPGPAVVGVDASEAMLEAARARRRRARGVGAVRPARLGPRLARPGARRRRHQLDPAVGSGPPAPPRRLGRALAEGGWFALQVPGNFDAPSHRLMRETAEHHERAGRAHRGARPAGRRRARDLLALPRPPRPRRRRLGDDPPPRPRPRGQGRQPGAHLGDRHGPAPGARHPHRAAGARRVPRAVLRAAGRGLPAHLGGVLFPFRRASPWLASAPAPGPPPQTAAPEPA